MTKIFISYRETDKAQKNGFVGTILNPNNHDFNAIPEFSKEDLRNKGEKVVKNHIKEQMKDCDAIVCLIGNNSHNSKWVDYEIEVAISQKKPIIPVRVKGTTGGLPPKIRDMKTIEWDAKKIQNSINKRIKK